MKKIISFVTVLAFAFAVDCLILSYESDIIISIMGVCFATIVILGIYFKTKYGEIILMYLRGLYWRTKVKNSPKKLRVGYRVKIFNPEKVEIGDNCDFDQNVAICPLGSKYTSKITIGNHVHFGAFDRIACMENVTIEDNVLFAAFVHVTDHSHEYRDVSKTVMEQGVFSKGKIVIKNGAWIAFGSHILSGVTIGEHSVVAANSVVTKDVPPYTVVAGNPARIVSKYNPNSKRWDKC